MNDFESIKSQLNLQSVILNETHFVMKGKHLEECPFCGGHKCFSIKDDFYKCFQCDAGGDVFTFLEEYLKVDKAEALKTAAALAGVRLAQSNKKPRALPIKEQIFIAAAKHYHENVTSNGGKEYLCMSRGHLNESIERMAVGWSSGELFDCLVKQGFSEDEIKKSGLVRERKVGDTVTQKCYLSENAGRESAQPKH